MAHMSKLWGTFSGGAPQKVNMAKVSTICWQFMRCGTDVMYLLDTRLSEPQRTESDQGDAGAATTWHLYTAKPARGGANYPRQWHMASLAKGTNKTTGIRTRRRASDRHYSERQGGRHASHCEQ